MAALLKYAPWVVALLMAASAVWGWYHPKTVAVPGAVQWLDGTTTITKTKTVMVPMRTAIRAIDKDKDERPDTFNENILTAEGEIPASGKEPGYEIKSTVSATTGETKLFYQPKQRSFFSFENDKELGARYGVGRHELDIFGRWTFARVGAFHTAIYAEGQTDTKGEATGNVLLEVSYRW
jgi:hypothetical protein